MEINQIQQGDVVFKKVASIPEGVTEHDNPRPGLITFAEGEVTGHHHSCVDDGVTLYEDKYGVLWCSVGKETTVTHQEHNPVTLPVGNYRVGIVKEYDPFEDVIRNVAD